MLPRLFESESVPPHEHLATHPSDSFNPILYFMDPSYRYFADTSESVKVKEPPTINPPSIDSYQPLPLPAITISSPPCSLPTLNQHQIPPQPPPPLKQFIAKLMKRTQLSHSSFVHALHLLHNIHHLHPTLRTLKNPECSRNYTFLMHRLLLGSLIISAKVLYDDTYDNQAWKAVAQGICTTVEDVNLLERAMLAILDFNVGASMSRLEWRRFCDNVANGLAELCCSDDGTGLAGAVTSIGREQEVSGSGCWVCWGDSNNPVQEEEEKLTPLPTNPPLIDESENNYQQLQNHQSAQLYGIRLKRNLVREIIYADTDSLVNSVDYSTVITRNRLVAMSESKKAEIIAVAEAAVAAENVTVPELEEQVRMRVFRSHLDIERGQDSAVELIGLSHLFLDDIPGTKDEEDDDFQILDCDGDLLQ
ncbi:hypothetical protein BDR26DRAFT_655331 [Obelidium mucronatum]|nr:hypothetical protein BDR26DRAFT_655331 [Obelidium mucronatum]